MNGERGNVDTFDLDSILEDERVLSAAGKYAETQPEPEDLSEANALGQEAMAHGITEVYGAQAALAYLKSGRFVMSQPSQQSTQATLDDRLRSRAVPVSISGVEQSDSIFTEAADEIERLRADNERLMRCCGKDDMRAEIKRLRDAMAHASEYLAQDASVPTVVNTIAQRLLAGESPEIVYGE